MSVPDTESNTAEVINLKALAEASSGSASLAGTPVQVEQLSEKRELEPTSNIWLLVLEGELIIDLPYGDFRILRQNDSLFVKKDTQATLNPVDPVTFIQAAV